MCCLACESQHSLSEGIEREVLVAIVLCDQNFPPILSTNNGKCLFVVRVEDGRLFELERTFIEILLGVIEPHGRLSVGSVVLVGSLSHLSSYGLESYAADLVRVVASMVALVGGGGGLLWPHTSPSPWVGLAAKRLSGHSSIWTHG